MMGKCCYTMLVLAVLLGVATAHAQVAAKPAISQDQPIEISSDKLDVFQADHKAIFTGNVIAVQGTTNMRSTEMVVFYRDAGADEKPGMASSPAPEKASTPQGIYKIEAQGNVVFTTPTEVVLGDKAIYNVDADTIDVFGRNVTLTRGQNILKGTKLNYNMGTGRSMLTGGVSGDGAVAGGKPARVHGLFVPKAEPKTQSKAVGKP